MKIFKIKIQWKVETIVEVEAQNIKEAKEKACSASNLKMSYGPRVVDDSFEVIDVEENPILKLIKGS